MDAGGPQIDCQMHIPTLAQTVNHRNKLTNVDQKIARIRKSLGSRGSAGLLLRFKGTRHYCRAGSCHSDWSRDLFWHMSCNKYTASCRQPHILLSPAGVI